MEKSWPRKNVNTVGSTDGMVVNRFWQRKTKTPLGPTRWREPDMARTAAPPLTLTVTFLPSLSYPPHCLHRDGGRESDGTIRG
ncbi:hypothetical protein SODG_003694 [Sodalis praecaptivus]